MIATIYKRLLQLGKVAGAITFLVGIPYGLWQYIEKQHDTRVEQSLKLFDKFNASPITGYREKISKAMIDNRGALEKAALDEKTYNATSIEVVEKNDIETSLWLMMDFFDGVTICVVNNICDAQTVDQLFAARAKDLYIVFYPYILDRRKGPSSAFGVGLVTIATNRGRMAGGN